MNLIVVKLLYQYLILKSKEEKMNKAKKILWFFVLAACIGAAGGCTGHLYTVQSPPFVDHKTDGVIVYQPETWVVTFVTTTRTDEKGNVLGTAESTEEGKKCVPVENYEIISKPDYSKQYAIAYKPGLFESHTFSLVLDNGMLQSVNVTATSAAKETLEILKETLSIAAGVAKFAKEAPLTTEEKPKCNTGRRVIKMTRFSEFDTSKLK
jgi:hypothetical protein